MIFTCLLWARCSLGTDSVEDNPTLSLLSNSAQSSLAVWGGGERHQKRLHEGGQLRWTQKWAEHSSGGSSMDHSMECGKDQSLGAEMAGQCLGEEYLSLEAPGDQGAGAAPQGTKV